MENPLNYKAISYPQNRLIPQVHDKMSEKWIPVSILNIDEDINSTDNTTPPTFFQDNRLSLTRALTRKEYDYAFAKISSNITSLCTNIQELQDYSLRIGSKSDNKNKSAKIDKLIVRTATLFRETFDWLNDIKEFGYSSKNEKIGNITEANKLENNCNKYKKIFQDLTNKIKKQNENIMERVRTSVGFSMISLSDIPMDETQANEKFKNGREFWMDEWYGWENKQKQNQVIEQSMFKIMSSSRKNSIQRELFPNQAQGSQSGVFCKNDFYRVKSFDFIKMEDKISIALKEPKGNIIMRNWGYVVLFAAIVAFVLWLMY